MQTELRFHDYDAIYSRAGLYEQLFYDRLKCQSPEKVVSILRHAMSGEPWLFNELRVLDLGAGGDGGVSYQPIASPSFRRSDPPSRTPVFGSIVMAW